VTVCLRDRRRPAALAFGGAPSAVVVMRHLARRRVLQGLHLRGLAVGGGLRVSSTRCVEEIAMAGHGNEHADGAPIRRRRDRALDNRSPVHASQRLRRL
jgi:hypothetical protein